ncbi:MAG TPA: ATP-grasp domain-containing protein, partial [Phycisphaerales bacterium]|nr:ATP-grasp domain-containing protein [Phycisphaerales bacterium]
MARLHEYQGKAILAQHGIAIPRGQAVSSTQQAVEVTRNLRGSVVIKIQAWTTGRAAIGGVAFADTPEQAAQQTQRMLSMRVGQFPVSQVLIEEKIDIAIEMFVSLSIDDRARQPVMLLSFGGGSGIEERAQNVHRLVCTVANGVNAQQLNTALASSPVPADVRENVASAVQSLFNIAKVIEARSLEINPLVITKDNRVIAADCRMTIDDYAVFRHPELGIDIARELDHPPTPLERIAYAVEQDDHRGTFYFAQLATQAAQDSRGLIGFHGAGGGGSMMSMDAITNERFTIAN